MQSRKYLMKFRFTGTLSFTTRQVERASSFKTKIFLEDNNEYSQQHNHAQFKVKLSIKTHLSNWNAYYGVRSAIKVHLIAPAV